MAFYSKLWIVFLFILATCPGPSMAERTTTSPYTTNNIQWLRNETAQIMSLSEAQTLAAVPDQSGIWFTDCPNCDKSTADAGHFDWNPADPGHIVCKDCGAVYPDNPKYPDNKVLEVRSIHAMHHYPYYVRSDGYRIYFKAHADFLARAYMARQCANLAELYWFTKDEQYARRSAIILVRFAQVYPGYALHYDFPDAQKRFAPYDSKVSLTPEEPPRTAKWSQWAYLDISQELTRAYDILRDWKPFDEMAGGKARQLVEHDLLGGMIDYTMGIEEDYSNMSPMRWRDAIDASRVTGRTEMVHAVVERLERFLNEKFLYDGSWMETSPSYMRQTAGWLDMINVSLEGYADPPGYTNPKTGRHLDAKAIAALRGTAKLALNKLSETRLPDGRFLPVNDTWSNDKWPPRDSMTSVLEPGFGVAVMGAGAGQHQYAAWLNFTSGRNHKQQDALSIGLWAHGKELLSDIGYTHTIYRYWATSTASHNTVLIDGTDQQYDIEYRMNRLRAWFTDGHGFHAAQAESDGIYPQAKLYRRTLIAVGQDSTDMYLVDVFQVQGGKQHDYLLAGNADEDSTADLPGLTLSPFNGTLLNPGVKFIIPANETRDLDPQSGLGYIRNLRSSPAPSTQPVLLDYRLTKSPTIGTRTWLWPGDDTTIYLGQAPSIRRSQGNDSMLDQFTMPMFVARRHGQDMQSTFVAIHEPINGSPKIEKVAMQRKPGVIQLQISHGGMLDNLFIALNDTGKYELSTPAGTIHFEGMQGFVRLENGKPTEAHLINGSQLNLDQTKLVDSCPSQKGEIVSAHPEQTPESGGWFTVNEKLPSADPSTLLLIHYPDGTTQGYHILQIDSPASSGSRIIVREKPALKYTENGIELTSYPHRTIKGKHASYELLQTKSLR
jgi:hypothetical protein